jgi:two-component system chemotaxis response regulator CheY
VVVFGFRRVTMAKVLIVDDSSFARIKLKQLLQKNGFEVVGEAENGKIALEKIRELRPDIVTLDITMQDMDGIECMSEIKKMDYMPTVIMVSAMGQEEFVKKAIMNGAKGFVVKPYKDEVVLQQLNKFK